MNNTYLYILLVIIASACQSGTNTDALDSMLRNQDVSKEVALEIIQKEYKSVESKDLTTYTKSNVRSGIPYDYTIYRSDNIPVKIVCDIKATTYTVQAIYYIHDTIPYYIYGTMRDQDIASGQYTHQELYTYLDGNKVIQQLRKTAVNNENRASNLSDIPTVDITKDILQPDLDASMKYEEIQRILSIK